MRVGIPRAMLYHHYGECWLAFLGAIGVEPVVTGLTSRRTVKEGASRADNETCLPVKVFTGHLLGLEGKVDAILIPRLVSIEHGTCSCPKFLGLPDMARALVPGLPPVLSPSMDLGDRRLMWLKDWYGIARAMGAGRKVALNAVYGLLRDLRARNERAAGPGVVSDNLKVGVAGHAYNVNDPGVSMDLLTRLHRLGVAPLTVEQCDLADARRQADTLPRRIFWGFERILAGVVLNWSRTGSVAGIVFLTSFACGPGSIIGSLLEDQLVCEGSVPFMTITLDEHSAEAGLVTRLEAFTDMLRRSSIRRV